MNLRLVTFFFLANIWFLSSCQLRDNTSSSAEGEKVYVIGGGLMGSAAAYYLSKAGYEVVLLEKQDSIYTSGSSQGQARIARSSNRGNDIWSYMHNTSVKEINKLIEDLTEAYPSRQFDISDIYTTNPVSYVGRMSIYEKLLASLIRQKVDYKIAINPEEGKRLFDVNLPEDVLLQREYNQYSGTINPQKLIEFLHIGIRANGGKVKYKHHVQSLSKINDVYELKLQNSHGAAEVIQTDHIVSAAGPYTGSLLHDVAPYFDELIHPQRVFLGFFKIDNKVYGELSERDIEKLNDAYPVINSSKGTRDGSFFSMIEYFDDDGSPVIKVGGHFQRTEIQNLDRVWEKGLTEKEIRWASESTIGYFKLLDLPIGEKDLIYDHGYSCVYSLTENEVPLVTPILDKSGLPDTNFVVLGGMSGIGAKGAMAYGLIASDIIKGKERSDTMYLHVKEEFGVGRLVEFAKH